MQRSSAALYTYGINDVTDHASCGATFVAPTMAITAGHCVDHLPPAPLSQASSSLSCASNACVSVKTVDIRSATLSSILEYGAITGSGPKFDTPQRDSAVSGADGLDHTYEASPMACWVRLNCHDGAGALRTSSLCDQVFGSGSTLDVAVLECPHRAATSDYVAISRVADEELVGTPAKTWWFHEVVYDGLADLQEVVDHYVVRGEDRNQNYHYAVPHLLFPFESTGSDDKVVASGKEVATVNIAGCHGTSGSGLGPAAEYSTSGNTVVWGPVVNAGIHSSLRHTLCEAEAAGGSQHLMNFVRGNQLVKLYDWDYFRETAQRHL